MNRPSTAREALIAETLGEVAALVERVEALAPTMDASRQALVQVSEELANQVATFENRMGVLTNNAVVVASNHILRRANEVTARTLDSQILAMQAAAREMFNKEFNPVVLRVVARLNHLAQLAQREENLCVRWFTHACAFVTGASLTCLVLLKLWLR
jgi:hypothetical protein